MDINNNTTAVEATVVEATVVEATVVEATVVEATVVEATAVEATTVETTDVEMVDVLEAEYYAAKDCKEAGGSYGPSLLQKCEFGPMDKRYMIERCSSDEDIPVEELAVQEDFLPEHIKLMESARAAGVFKQGKGTVEVPETNGVVFAGIWETEKYGRIIRVLFRQENGEYTSPFELDNAMFVIAAENGFETTDKSNPFSREIASFHKKATMEIVNRLPLRATIQYKDILRILRKYYSSLPVHKLIQGEASVETIYGEILQFIAAHGTERHTATKYFRLDKEEMEKIAESLSMPVKQVCVVLKENELLYLTPSSKGYQTKVKYKGTAENYYCVRNDFGQQKIPQYEPTVLEDGAMVIHDGTVSVPATVYHQLFDGNHPSALNSSSKSTESSKKTSGFEAWDGDL